MWLLATILDIEGQFLIFITESATGQRLLRVAKDFLAVERPNLLASQK
jgi:hypothetical protein